MSSVTQILESVNAGSPEAPERLFNAVYAELKSIAKQHFVSRRDGHTLQPTALVNEAYLRLFGGKPSNWESRAHFFASAAEAMRRIIVEYARQRKSKKRGGDLCKLRLEGNLVAATVINDDLIDLSEAMEHLQAEHPVKHQLVSLRYFAGLTIAEAASLLQISVPTANRYWSFARAWLFDWIQRNRD